MEPSSRTQITIKVMMKYLFIFASLCFVAFIVMLSVVIVDETEHVIVTQFGRLTAVYSDPGLRWKLPSPIEQVTRLNKRILFLETKDIEILTADKKNVVVSAFILWKINDPLQYYATLRSRDSAELRLNALITSALGSSFGEKHFSEIVSETGLAYTKEALQSRISGRMEGLERSVATIVHDTAATNFGIEVLNLGLTRFVFPYANLTSVYSRMRAERERIAKRYRSEGEAEAKKILAEANRESAEIVAGAEADAARLKGEGEAQSAKIYADAYTGHYNLFNFLRTLEAYERIFNETTTIVLPSDSPFLDLLIRFRPEGPSLDRKKGKD
jgi:modulator of FtsH protease HflC